MKLEAPLLIHPKQILDQIHALISIEAFLTVVAFNESVAQNLLLVFPKSADTFILERLAQLRAILEVRMQNRSHSMIVSKK